MEILLDGRMLQDKETAHPYLKEKLGFPDYYGNNLDALYDCLTEICEETDISVLMEEGAGESEYFGRLLRVFEDASEGDSPLSFSLSYEKAPAEAGGDKAQMSDKALRAEPRGGEEQMPVAGNEDAGQSHDERHFDCECEDGEEASGKAPLNDDEKEAWEEDSLIAEEKAWEEASMIAGERAGEDDSVIAEDGTGEGNVDF